MLGRSGEHPGALRWRLQGRKRGSSDCGLHDQPRGDWQSDREELVHGGGIYMNTAWSLLHAELTAAEMAVDIVRES